MDWSNFDKEIQLLDYPSAAGFERFIVMEIRGGKTTVHLDHATRAELHAWLLKQPGMAEKYPALNDPLRIDLSYGPLVTGMGCEFRRAKVPGHKEMRDAYHAQIAAIKARFKETLFAFHGVQNSPKREKAFEIAEGRGGSLAELACEFERLSELL